MLIQALKRAKKYLFNVLCAPANVISTIVEKSYYRKLRTLVLLVILGFAFESCSSSDSQNDESASQESNVFPEFTNFPNKQFLSIQLGMQTVNAEEILKANDFIMHYGEDSKYYIRSNDSIEVILPESETLYELKIFIKKSHYLAKTDDFKSFLGKNASNTNKKTNLIILEFKDIDKPFKLNYFKQKDFIRLKFTLK